MNALTHKTSGWTIGTGKPLSVIAGLNVLEDEGLSLEVGSELKRICEQLGLPYVCSRRASTRRTVPRSSPFAAPASQTA